VQHCLVGSEMCIRDRYVVTLRPGDTPKPILWKPPVIAQHKVAYCQVAHRFVKIVKSQKSIVYSSFLDS
jgi:hypothetical protein